MNCASVQIDLDKGIVSRETFWSTRSNPQALKPRLSSSNVRFIEPVFGRSVGARSFDLHTLALVVANSNPNGF